MTWHRFSEQEYWQDHMCTAVMTWCHSMTTARHWCDIQHQALNNINAKVLKMFQWRYALQWTCISACPSSRARKVRSYTSLNKCHPLQGYKRPAISDAESSTWQNWEKLQVKLKFSIQNWGKVQVKLEFCHVGTLLFYSPRKDHSQSRKRINNHYFLHKWFLHTLPRFWRYNKV